MPHYFLDVYNREALIDRHGQAFPRLARARQEAIRTAAAMIRDVSPHGSSSERIVVQVRDDVGNILATAQVEFSMRDGA